MAIPVNGYSILFVIFEVSYQHFGDYEIRQETLETLIM